MKAKSNKRFISNSTLGLGVSLSIGILGFCINFEILQIVSDVF